LDSFCYTDYLLAERVYFDFSRIQTLHLLFSLAANTLEWWETKCRDAYLLLLGLFLPCGGASKNSKGAGRPREGESIAMAAMATTRARGGVPSSAHSMPRIALRDGSY